MASLTQGWYGGTITYNSAGNYTITGATVTGTTAGIWNAWTNQQLVTNSAVTTATWTTWVTQSYYRKETKKEALARAKREREEGKRFAELQRQATQKAAEANNRAEKLLVEHLSDTQREMLAKHNYFDVQIGAKTYRVHRGTHGNVRLLDETGKEKILYCVQPPGVPVPDVMLAQKLHLEADEAGFLQVANARPM